MNLHEKYMKRCLDLAEKSFGNVSPNPMVGCAIVHNNKVIGEGYHKKFGEAHAEVNAINSVKNKSLLKNSTLYTNLEPCYHFGKTPPCADLIIRYGIKYVIIGTIDPNPVVNGKGINKLVSSGCDVKTGVLENECMKLNERFFTFHEKQRPYIILKWAQTHDGYIGRADGKGIIQISGSKSQKLVHQWRSEEQAIMIGTNTALTDNPKLTVRKINGRSPLRIVMDKKLKIPASFHLMDGKVPTLVFTEKKETVTENLEFIRINFRKTVLKQVLGALYERKIQSLIVEGGAKLLYSFIKEKLWDEARIFTGKKTFFEIAETLSNGIVAPKLNNRCRAKKVKIGSDVLKIYLH